MDGGGGAEGVARVGGSTAAARRAQARDGKTSARGQERRSIGHVKAFGRPLGGLLAPC